MKPYNSVIAITAFAASLQLSPAAQADASYLYMIPSMMSMGTSIYHQHQAMAMQEEAQRRQMENLRLQQSNPQCPSISDMAELKNQLNEQQKTIADLQRRIVLKPTIEMPN